MLRLSRLPPLTTSISTTEKRGTRAMTVKKVTSALIKKLKAVRGRRRDFSNLPRSIPAAGGWATGAGDGGMISAILNSFPAHGGPVQNEGPQHIDEDSDGKENQSCEHE